MLHNDLGDLEKLRIFQILWDFWGVLFIDNLRIFEQIPTIAKPQLRTSLEMILRKLEICFSLR